MALKGVMDITCFTRRRKLKEGGEVCVRVFNTGAKAHRRRTSLDAVANLLPIIIIITLIVLLA